MWRIKDWDRFEINRHGDRPKRGMSWCSLPCDLNSTGYAALMCTREGPQHYGVFISLVQIVASLPLDIRTGALVSPQGTPLDAFAIALKSRIAVEAVRDSIERLLDPTVGWLTEEVDGNSGGHDGNSPESPANKDKDKDKDKKNSCPSEDGREDAPFSLASDAQPPLTLDQQQANWFDAAWALYWRKEKKDAAQRAFRAKVKDEATNLVVGAAIEAQSKMMRQRSEQYRPLMSSWLNGGGWKDKALLTEKDVDELAERLKQFEAGS